MNPNRPIIEETQYVGYATIDGILCLYDDADEFRAAIGKSGWGQAGWIDGVRRHVTIHRLEPKTMPSLQLPPGFSIQKT